MVYPMPVTATGYQPYPGVGMPVTATAMPLQSYAGAQAFATQGAAYPVTRPMEPAVVDPNHQITTTVNQTTSAYPPDNYFAEADKAAVEAFERTKHSLEVQHQQVLALFPQNDSKTRRLLEQAATQPRVIPREHPVPAPQPRALSTLSAQQPAPWQPPATPATVPQPAPVKYSYETELPAGGVSNFPQTRQYSSTSSAPREPKPHAKITVRPKSVQAPQRQEPPPQQPPQRLVTKVVTKVWPPDSWFNSMQELPANDEEYHAPSGPTPFYVPPKALPLAPGWQGEAGEETLVATETAHRPAYAPAAETTKAPPPATDSEHPVGQYIPINLDPAPTGVSDEEAMRRYQQAEAEALEKVRQFEDLEFEAQQRDRRQKSAEARSQREAEEAAYQAEMEERERHNQNIRREIEYRKKQQEERRRFPHFECNGCGCGIMQDEVVYKPRLVDKSLEHKPVLIPKGKRGAPAPPPEPLPEPMPIAARLSFHPPPREPSFHPPPREPSFHPPPREPSFHPPPREPSFHPPPREPSFHPPPREPSFHPVESFHEPPPRMPSLRDPEPEPEQEEEYGIKTIENFDFDAARHGVKTVPDFDFDAARHAQAEVPPPPPPEPEEPAPTVDSSEYGIKTVENFDFDAARANQAVNEYGLKTIENFDFDAARQAQQAPPARSPYSAARSRLMSATAMVTALERLKKKQLFVRGPSNQPAQTIEANVDDENNLCVVCLEKEKCVVMFPCKHLSTCTNCAAALDECPMCRAPIENRLEVFV